MYVDNKIDIKERNYSVNCVDVNADTLITDKDVYAPELDEKNKKQLIELINEYRNENKFNQALVRGLKIELTSCEPVSHRPYRLSLADREALKEIIENLKKKILLVIVNLLTQFL